MTRLHYTQPRINGVIIATGEGDILEAYKKSRSHEIASALRSIETPDLSMTQLYLHCPEPPEITMLDPVYLYPDGQANRRRRRERERAARKNR